MPPEPDEQGADGPAFYHRVKRAALVGTLFVIPLPALVLALWHPWFAIALAAGGTAGLVNALFSMHGNERLLDGRSISVFVLSSFVRIGLFGIVPVILAVREPSVWTLGWYFIGFFTPLALSGIVAHLGKRPGG